MGFFADFMPFYPKSAPRRRRKKPKYDVERALDVELHTNPDCEMRRADTGELVLRVKRQLHPAEKVLGRLFGSTQHRQIVLDKYGEFLITEGTRPGRSLAEVATMMADTFEIPLEDARMGIIQVVQQLMVRDFVFLVRRGPSPADPAS